MAVSDSPTAGIFGSYALTRVRAASSGTTAAGSVQAARGAAACPRRHVGRDPNDLTNARGRLANDRAAHVSGDGHGGYRRPVS
jgi:hypothetical protein